MEKIKIAVIDSCKNPYINDINQEKKCLGRNYDVSLIKVSNHCELPNNIGDYEGIISWYLVSLPKQLIARLDNCKIIVRAAVGFENIDIKFANERGILVANVPDYGTEEVADHTMTLLLCLIRNLFYCNNHVNQGGWQWKSIGKTIRLSDAEIGLLGFGRIGKAVAVRAKAFGLKVSFFDPYAPSGEEKSIAVKRYETLSEMLESVDILSIHVPLNEETHHIISDSEFTRMQDGITLINCARGGIVDTNAMLAALDSGKLSAVGLDVLEEEPTVPDELLYKDNVVITPHSAFYSDRSWEEIRMKSARNIMRYFNNEFIRDKVN